jgi:hypothetical protein
MSKASVAQWKSAVWRQVPVIVDTTVFMWIIFVTVGKGWRFFVYSLVALFAWSYFLTRVLGWAASPGSNRSRLLWAAAIGVVLVCLHVGG